VKRLWVPLLLPLLLFCMANATATQYVVVNGNNSNSNSAIMYKLNTRTGRLTKTAVLKTGGQVFGNPPNLFQVQQAVGPQASCIFVLDDGSSDIAAFSKASAYSRVGRYFDANLIAGFYGGSVEVTPDGRYLYAVYEETGNIGAWAVDVNCGLTLVARYFDNYAYGPARVTPDGKYLIVSGSSDSAFLYGINQTDGTLTSLGSVGFYQGVCARERSGCFTYGVDITKDSKFAIFASTASNITRQYGIPVALTARITPSGFINPRACVLTHSKGWETNIFPFLGAAGYAGLGDAYFSMWGAGNGLGPGVLTMTFTEHPMGFRLKNSTLVKNAPFGEDGNIAVTGNTMVVAQYPDQIGVFRINKDGSLKLLSTTTIDEQGEGLFSLSIFPNTR
jgi:hypothetical protein